MFFFYQYGDHRDLHSFPTRRSSDLNAEASTDITLRSEVLSYSRARGLFAGLSLAGSTVRPDKDRKSTRLNSSHMSISYAVFCLKKKKFSFSYHNGVYVDYHPDIYQP